MERPVGSLGNLDDINNGVGCFYANKVLSHHPDNASEESKQPLSIE